MQATIWQRNRRKIPKSSAKEKIQVFEKYFFILTTQRGKIKKKERIEWIQGKTRCSRKKTNQQRNRRKIPKSSAKEKIRWKIPKRKNLWKKPWRSNKESSRKI